MYRNEAGRGKTARQPECETTWLVGMARHVQGRGAPHFKTALSRLVRDGRFDSFPSPPLFMPFTELTTIAGRLRVSKDGFVATRDRLGCGFSGRNIRGHSVFTRSVEVGSMTKRTPAAGMLALVLIATPSLAHAGVHLSFGFGLPLPFFGIVAPAPAVVAPAPVYVPPPPAYYAYPPPVVAYGPPAYYGPPGYYGGALVVGGGHYHGRHVGWHGRRHW